MANDVGKTPAVIRLFDGSVVNLYNRFMDSTINGTGFFSDGGESPKYVMSSAGEGTSEPLRCAYFSRSFPASGIDLFPRPLLYVPGYVSSYGNVAYPLFEFISPSSMVVDQDKFQISWWSNVDDVNLLSLKISDRIPGERRAYNHAAIRKFTKKDIEDFKDNRGATQILCTSYIRWERLMQRGGGVNDAVPFPFPIISTVVISAMVTGEGYVTDFSTGGGGGGGMARMHDHTSNDQCGFAAAVFMPSANVRVFNWK